MSGFDLLTAALGEFSTGKRTDRALLLRQLRCSRQLAPGAELWSLVGSRFLAGGTGRLLGARALALVAQPKTRFLARLTLASRALRMCAPVCRCRTAGAAVQVRCLDRVLILRNAANI